MMPIEDQREHLISEQEDVLISLNLPNEYIMNLIKMEFEKDSFIVEPKLYRQRKNIFRIYKGLQVLLVRKYEIFINLVLFQNIIVKFWNDRFTQDTILWLVRAGMVLTNIRIWRDFIIARDSGIETIEKELVKKPKRKEKSRKPKGSLQPATRKVYEEKGPTQSSEQTVIDMEQSNQLI